MSLDLELLQMVLVGGGRGSLADATRFLSDDRVYRMLSSECRLPDVLFPFKSSTPWSHLNALLRRSNDAPWTRVHRRVILHERNRATDEAHRNSPFCY